MSTRFLLTKDDQLIPLSQIEPITKRGFDAVIETKFGTLEAVEDFDELYRCLRQVPPIEPIFPAYPGWTELQFIEDSGSVLKFEVIGWGYTDNRLYPITMDETLTNQQTRDHFYVMPPSGSVHNPSWDIWNNYDGWLADMKQRSQRKA
jgi:hypothetical protein